MQRGLVSVVIPNYNYAHFLREAIDSVLAQTYSDIEIIVVDDGSSDASSEVLESYGKRVRTVFQKNQGVSAARNNGAEISRGEFIAFLDADDSWLPAKLEKQSEIFAADPELGMVHVGFVEIDEAGRELLERTNGLEGRVAEELLRFERSVILGGGSGIMVRREAFVVVGGFDLRMSTSADWDFFYRISSGYSVGFVPEVLLKYRVHALNMHGNIVAMEHDMMLGFEKAFAADRMANRRTFYGNLHKTLSASYFRAGKYADFGRHVIQSIWNRPFNIGYFLQFPLRRMRNK